MQNLLKSGIKPCGTCSSERIICRSLIVMLYHTIIYQLNSFGSILFSGVVSTSVRCSSWRWWLLLVISAPSLCIVLYITWLVNGCYMVQNGYGLGHHLIYILHKYMLVLAQSSKFTSGCRLGGCPSYGNLPKRSLRGAVGQRIIKSSLNVMDVESGRAPKVNLSIGTIQINKCLEDHPI